MDGCQQQSRAVFELNSDFISCLPSELIEKILVKLPIKETVRTSILSSKWKYLWASIPDLVFIDDSTESELIRSVDMVLLAHRGPILTFELECEHVCTEAIDRWALILSQNGIKDLRLKFDIYGDEKIFSSLFSCHTLEHVEIWDCSINAPQFFEGFKLLRSLKLCASDLIGINLGKLVSSCPLLESLSLCDFFEHECLAICAPNLKQLDLIGACTDIFLDTPKLVSACICLKCISHDNQNFNPASDGCKSKILCALGRLSNIEELEMGSKFCEYLASGPIPMKLPITFHRLKEIVIYMNGRKEETDAALCILRNAPNLKTLYLKVPSQNVWIEQMITTAISLFKHLEIIKIVGF